MKFFERAHRHVPFGKTEHIRLDPLAPFGRNVEEVTLRFLSKGELKRL